LRENGGETNGGGLDRGRRTAAVGDGHRVTRGSVADLIENNPATGVGLAVDGHDGVGSLEPRGTGLLTVACDIYLGIAAFKRRQHASIAMREEIVIKQRAAVCMQKRKRGHYNKKDILKTCGSLRHMPIGEIVAALLKIGAGKLQANETGTLAWMPVLFGMGDRSYFFG